MENTLEDKTPELIESLKRLVRYGPSEYDIIVGGNSALIALTVKPKYPYTVLFSSALVVLHPGSRVDYSFYQGEDVANQQAQIVDPGGAA
jgi:hypothetical protein